MISNVQFEKKVRRNSKRGKRVTQEQHDYVVDTVIECLRELSKKEYELGKLRDPWFSVCTRDFGRSCAGSGEIRINVHNIWAVDNQIREYKSFSSDPIIGSFSTVNDELPLKCLIAHEVAHHVQYNYCREIRRFKNTYRKPHGQCFRTIYRYLRQSLINPYA